MVNGSWRLRITVEYSKLFQCVLNKRLYVCFYCIIDSCLMGRWMYDIL